MRTALVIVQLIPKGLEVCGFPHLKGVAGQVVCALQHPKSLPRTCFAQMCILFGWGPGQGRQRAPQEMWAQRVEMMQLELGALTQRVEALGGELRMAAQHLAAARSGTPDAQG